MTIHATLTSLSKLLTRSYLAVKKMNVSHGDEKKLDFMMQYKEKSKLGGSERSTNIGQRCLWVVEV